MNIKVNLLSVFMIVQLIFSLPISGPRTSSLISSHENIIWIVAHSFRSFSGIFNIQDVIQNETQSIIVNGDKSLTLDFHDLRLENVSAPLVMRMFGPQGLAVTAEFFHRDDPLQVYVSSGDRKLDRVITLNQETNVKDFLILMDTCFINDMLIVNFGEDLNGERLGETIGETLNCPICLQHIKDPHNETLPCNHTFHRYCIAEWYNRNPTCPLCRARVEGFARDTIYSLESSFY